MKALRFLLVLLSFVLIQTAHAAQPVFAPLSQTDYARKLPPPAGKALIYIYQPQQGNTANTPDIVLNNYKIGRLVPGSFSVWQLAPGQLNIRLEEQAGSSISLVSQAGKVYLFRITVANATSQARIESLPASFRNDLAATQLLKNPQAITQSKTNVQPSPPPKPVAKPKASTPAPSEPARATRTAPARPVPADGFAILLKTGALTLSEETQSILAADRQFDDSASSLFAVEGYYQYPSGLALGGELISYQAEFTTVGSNDTHDVDVLIALANVKKYFRSMHRFQPYIGAGIGLAVTDISGPTIFGNTSGAAYQLTAGAEYRGASVGVFAEYRLLGADTEDDNGQGVDVSGSGIFAGVAFHF